MSREISSYPLPHFLRDSLLKAGFRVAADLQDISPSELAKGIFIDDFNLLRRVQN